MESGSVSKPALSPERFIQMGMGFWASKTLMSAVELGVCTELGKGARTADELCRALKLHQRGIADFLDALVALGVIEREGSVYRNTPDADQFLDKNKPSYVGGIIEMAGARPVETVGTAHRSPSHGQAAKRHGWRSESLRSYLQRSEDGEPVRRSHDRHQHGDREGDRAEVSVG